MITVFICVAGSIVTMSPEMLVTMKPLRAGPNGAGRGRCGPDRMDADDDAAALVDAAGAVGADEGLVDAAAQAPTDIATMTATLALKTSEA
jgi:hypothetical protein